MIHLDFVLWLVLWPVMSNASRYIKAQTRVIKKLEQKEENDKTTEAILILLKLVIYIGIAVLLYKT